jgi:hypothetical protein
MKKKAIRKKRLNLRKTRIPEMTQIRTRSRISLKRTIRNLLLRKQAQTTKSLVKIELRRLFGRFENEKRRSVIEIGNVG